MILNRNTEQVKVLSFRILIIRQISKEKQKQDFSYGSAEFFYGSEWEKHPDFGRLMKIKDLKSSTWSQNDSLFFWQTGSF